MSDESQFVNWLQGYQQRIIREQTEATGASHPFAANSTR